MQPTICFKDSKRQREPLYRNALQDRRCLTNNVAATSGNGIVCAYCIYHQNPLPRRANGMSLLFYCQENRRFTLFQPLCPSVLNKHVFMSKSPPNHRTNQCQITEFSKQKAKLPKKLAPNYRILRNYIIFDIFYNYVFCLRISWI